MPQLMPLLVMVGVAALVLFGTLILIARFYRQVDQGRALIINTMRAEPVVTFTGAVVYPIINRAEQMDMSVKMVEIDRRGKEGLICADNIRADINVSFFVRVNKTQEDVLKVAQSIGCARASDGVALSELFSAKFSEALKTVGKHFNFEDLYKMREEFKDEIIKVIGKDLNGFVLDDAAIDYLEQTTLESLDPNNIMDAEGIRKITDLTVAQNVQTNQLRQKERMEVGSQNLSADEAVFRFDQRRAEAEAKKNREIAVAEAREQNEALRVASDEAKKTQLVRLKNEEEAQVADQARQRGVAIAEKNREREIAVETERVERARQLEVVAREREVSLGVIAKEKDLEVQKKEIADVVRTRIVVDKSVATEEEAIKDLRTQAGAKRERDVVRIAAEAEAESAMVKQVKAAEAAEEAAKFKAKEKIVTAEAELDTADKLARAKIRLAEGKQAEAAAEGLATVKVKEADALATEKQGKAQATVVREKLLAEAAGEEQKGLAQARVKEAGAQATEKQGQAEATVVREKLLAEAAGEEQRGLAQARVKEAGAQATEKQGQAEAVAVKEKLLAEAAGLAEKAASMKALDDAGRGHEEFRLKLDKEKTVELESIRNRKDIAAAQAVVLKEAFGHAKINIVGGDGQFFDRFIKAVGVGQSIEGVLEQSDTVRQLAGDVLGGPMAKDPAIAAMLSQFLSKADPAARQRLESLLQKPQG